jgi:hypothetical protein
MIDFTTPFDVRMHKQILEKEISSHVLNFMRGTGLRPKAIYIHYTDRSLLPEHSPRSGVCTSVRVEVKL